MKYCFNMEKPMDAEQRERDLNTLLPFQTKAEAGLVGAAVGDALGWPDEGRATRTTRESRAIAARGEFISWVRKAGGRFYSHEEEIKRGEYSDDTQLLISTSRSLAHREEWYRVLTELELPLWTAYERGGGGATKRAAAAWVSGKAPWATPAVDQRRYFGAGGNGVVMRILPHCVWEGRSASFSIAANSIIKNGTTTHGHPRALVSALAYGFAVWHQLQSSETLGYGALLDLLLDTSQVWSAFPERVASMPGWLERANATTEGCYADLWLRTVEEQLILFKTAKTGIAKGALAVDQEVLNALGCFDKRISGSGTVAAAAAVFLASRYAADPLNGLCEAAYSRGADTDTLASLVGGLLGIVNGLEWLGPLADQVQDSAYLRSLARDLSDKKSVEDSKLPRITEAGLNRFLHTLPTVVDGQSITLPDGREATVARAARQPVGSGKMERVLVVCKTASGQMLHLKTFMKAQTAPPSTRQRSADVFDAVKVERVVVRLPVRDFEQAKRFYVNALGMRITKERPGSVTLSGVLALNAREAAGEQQVLAIGAVETQHMRVFVETKDLEAAHRNVQRIQNKDLSEISLKNNRRHFVCSDPDGNWIEVFEPRST